eukprot:gene11325-biopygen1429
MSTVPHPVVRPAISTVPHPVVRPAISPDAPS